MTKPRRVSALSSVLKEAQEYNKVTQEEEQVSLVEQETVDADKHATVNTDIQKPVSTELQKSVDTVVQKSATTTMQKTVDTETNEKTHKQTILISENLAFRLKVHAARKKETIASITTRALEKLLAEEENQ